MRVSRIVVVITRPRGAHTVLAGHNERLWRACSTGVLGTKTATGADVSRINSSGGTCRGHGYQRSARRLALVRRYHGTARRNRDRAATATARTRSTVFPSG